ncbi:NUDIX hydrolase [Actinomadura hibisca]|uniref:NUDIX hydrolase n=1 Tax=Actinomadura hibisca TaxID=68565 RepID=UPI000830ECD0|nr:NUDIX domain-containing protein [Actinomadura hibisca]
MPVPRLAVTVDLVVLTVREQRLSALMWRRDRAPYDGAWSLPGGFIQLDEDLPAAASRLMAERAGLADVRIHLEQLATYGYPDRDPRQRVVSVAYLGLAPNLPASTRAQVLWADVAELMHRDKPAFDHRRILGDGVERARAKLEYTSLAAAFCPPEFTVAELRRVYEIVWGTPLDPRNFHRKVTGADRFLIPTGHTTTRDGGRPARLYVRGDAEQLRPPMLRPRPENVSPARAAAAH